MTTLAVPIIVGAIALLLCSLGLWLFLGFDAELRRLYNLDRRRWRDIGRPIGFLWMPERAEAAPLMDSMSARTGLLVDYIISRKRFRERMAQGEPDLK